jgi:hypothetical protein
MDKTYDTNVAIDCGYPLVCVLLQQFGGDELLQSEDNTIATSDTDASAAVLDSLHGIFDLDWSLGDRIREGQMIVGLTWKLRPSGEKTELDRS